MGKHRGFSILVVDDDHDLRFSVASILEHFGEVYEASDGREAIRLLAKMTFDLIVTDYMMPHYDGFEVLRTAIQNRKTMVIMMTAHSTKSVAIRAQNSGSFRFLEKPFTSQELLHFVAEVLDFKLYFPTELERTVTIMRLKHAKSVDKAQKEILDSDSDDEEN